MPLNEAVDVIFGFSELRKTKKIIIQVLAEAIGTFFLMTPLHLVTSNVRAGELYHESMLVAIANGACTAVLCDALGWVSGGHLNPAITIGMFVTGEIKLIKGFFYIFAQCLGATGGVHVVLTSANSTFEAWKERAIFIENITELYLTFRPVAWTNLTEDNEPDIMRYTHLYCATVRSDLTDGTALALESLGTFAQMLVMQAMHDYSRRGENMGFVGVGFGVAAIHAALSNFTSLGTNPARSYATAAYFNIFDKQWAFWYGPIYGAISSALIYRFFFRLL